jgi:hypothetical protein
MAEKRLSPVIQLLIEFSILGGYDSLQNLGEEIIYYPHYGDNMAPKL